MPLRIILDSNFLFVPLQFHVDIFEELGRVADRKIEPVLLTPVYEELKKLATKEGVKEREGEMALRYSEKLKLINVEAEPGENVDDFILRIATERRWPVATNDRKLRKRLRDMNITVIYLRKRSHLEVDGSI